MDQKRDSRSQRVKNLQYKSRGRGRHHGLRQEAPAPLAGVADLSSEAEDNQFAESRVSSNRLASNWDRYLEPGEEADTVGTVADGTGAVKKQSEGLDYSSLLEEADALLSGGAAALLKHFTVDEDFDDPYSAADVEEQPLPLGIDLRALNDALSCLSLPERLGLERELFLSEEDEEPSVAETPDSATKSSGQAAPAPKSETGHQDIGLIKTTAAPTPSNQTDAPKSVPRLDPQLPFPDPVRSRPGLENGGESAGERNGPARGAPQPKASNSGRETELDNKDLLALLLGESDRPEVGRSQTSLKGPGRVPKRQWGDREADPRRSPESPANGVASLRINSSARNDPEVGISESQPGMSASVVVHGRAGETEEEGSAKRPAADATVSSTADDAIDGLLAVLTPSVSGLQFQASLSADKPALKGGLGKGAGSSVHRVGKASGPPSRLPQADAVVNRVETSRKQEPAVRQSTPHNTAPPSKVPKVANQDEDFDAWLDSIS